MIKIQNLKNIEFNITNLCNAKCPGCVRTAILYPKDEWKKEYFTKNFPMNSIDPELFETIADGLGNHAKNIVASFCGTTGDAPNHPHIDQIVDIAVNRYKLLVIETNGSIRNETWWEQLAKKPNLIVRFAIDGLQDTNPLYRINTNFDKIIKNATTFINAGGKAEWKFIIFDHNKHQVNEAHELSKQLGFRSFQTVLSKRFEGDSTLVLNNMYSAKASNVDQNIKQKGFQIKPAVDLDSLIPEVVTWQRQSADQLNQHQNISISCRVADEGYLFIDQWGKLWPCCFWSVENESPWSDTGWKWGYWWEKFQTQYGNNFNQLSKDCTVIDLLEHDLIQKWLPDSFSGVHDKCTVCIAQCTSNKNSKNKLVSIT